MKFYIIYYIYVINYIQFFILVVLLHKLKISFNFIKNLIQIFFDLVIFKINENIKIHLYSINFNKQLLKQKKPKKLIN